MAERRRRAVLAAAALLLAGCIPQAQEPPARRLAVPAAEPPRRPAEPSAPAAELSATAARAAPARAPRAAAARRNRPPPPIAAGDGDDRDVSAPPRRTFRGPRPPAPAAAAARPAWEAHLVAPDAVAVAGGSETVRPGDTLGRVSARTGAGIGAIARANGLTPPFRIAPGQRLAIPAGRYHLVRPGETGIGIARAYGIEWSRIVAANALAEPYVLAAGERILIPAAAAGPSALAERAAAFRLDIDDILTGGEPAAAPRQAPARPVRTAARVLPATALVAPPAQFDGGFAWPVDGSVARRFGRGGSGQRSDGIEIAAAPGTPIRAAAAGVVAYAGDGIAALGGLVLVRHGEGWTSVYGHASRLLVRRGQAVRRGQTIALAGDTGYAERPEVHFELRKGRVPVDPLGELPRR